MPAHVHPVKVIGLTGNIACGKSTVAGMLRDLGATVVDADAVVRELQEPGTPVWQQIVQAFGRDILRPDGHLDRARLGALVFADPRALARLEAIVHPAVVAEVDRILAGLPGGVAVVEAVKLVEAGMHRAYDLLWVVVCSEARQIDRLKGRGLTEPEARARLAAQPPLEPRLALADLVVDNDGSLADTRRQVEAAWAKLGGVRIAHPR